MKLFQYILSIALIATAVSCKQAETVNPNNLPVNGPYTTLPATLKAYAAPLQQLNVNADSGGAYRLARGTLLKIPKGAFQNPNGDTTHGTVQVTFAEYLDRSEFIFSNILTDNVDTVENLIVSLNVNSAGAFFFKPSQKGLAIQLRSGAGIIVHLPQRNLLAANQPGIRLQTLLGTQNDLPIGSVTWFYSPSRDNQSYSVAFDTVAYRFDTVGYHQPFQALQFFQGPSTVRFSMSGVDGITTGNSFTYLLPKGIRSVIDIGSGPRLRNRPFNVQDQVEVNLVGVAVVNGRFYGGITTTKLENNKSYGITVKEADPAAFKTAILNLL